jgi:hypothetical protein
MEITEWEKLKAQGSDHAETGKFRNKYTRNEVSFQGDSAIVSTYNRKNQKNNQLIVDIRDYELIRNQKWCVNKIGYAVTWKEGKIQYLHHVILNHSPNHKMVVDHANGNPLDNRRDNLRICTKSQNSANGKSAGKTSNYRGVYFDKSKNKWVARAILNGVVRLFKRYKTETEAALAYNMAALALWGKYAKLNETGVV